MKSLLLKLQDTVQQYADIMSRISGIDVEVVDSNLYRVAGTGIFAAAINEDMSEEGHVYRQTIRSGQVQIIDNPRFHMLCQKCRHRETCKEEIEISKPILMDQDCIGVIGLVGSSPEQKETILQDREMYLTLLDQIADFIAGKARDYYEAAKRDAVISTLNLITDHVTQGVLVIGSGEIITIANKAAKKQIGVELLEGCAINLEPTGDRINNGMEYRLQVKDRELLVSGQIYLLPTPYNMYEKILIFTDNNAFLNQVYDTTRLVNQVDSEGIIGTSESTVQLKREIAKIAGSTSTVLITGESGTGKEVAATAIWKLSDRRNNKFVSINCGAIPEALLESELFGYVKGAFTGADPKGRIGKFELAHEGVLFLDEIGDMPLYLQVKLLRVLQERKIVRIGSNQIIPIDVRIIAATNRDLKEMIAAKKFREDLYYRLNVIPLRIAPLRERPEDIEALAYYFAARYAHRFGKEFYSITPEAMLILRTYPWGGNVRELENTIEFMINMMNEDGILGKETLPIDFFKQKRQEKETRREVSTLKELEQEGIQRAINIYGSNTAGKKAAAKSLGIGLATLYRKLEQYEIE